VVALFKKLSIKKEIYIRLGYMTELFIVMLILIMTYCRGIQDVPFMGDESQWIATSYYFEAILDHDLIFPTIYQKDIRNTSASNLVWGNNYWTLTQPPLTRYIIALGRLSGGYQVKDLNTPWDWGSDSTKNQALGALQSPQLLWWSRLPMALLASISGLIFFLLVRSCAGVISGYTFIVLFISNPYFLVHLRRAMGESPLLLFTGLTIAAGVGTLAKWDQIKQPERMYTSLKSFQSLFLWFMLIGVGAGLAGATKLNGLVLSLAGVFISYLIFLMSKANTTQKIRVSLVIRTSVLLLLVTGTVFVIVNPYLYSNPLGNTTLMFLFRGAEIENQKISYPDYDIPDIGTRLRIVPQRIFNDYMILNFKDAWIINIFFFGLGAYYLVRNGLMWLMNKGGSSTGVSILVIAGVTSLPSLFTPFDWDRYYLFPVIFVSIFIAIGIGISLSFMGQWIWVHFKYLMEGYRICP
jgi:4-amino-4-deoxy-L-arabinose transferase-like glycosyltransferase